MSGKTTYRYEVREYGTDKIIEFSCTELCRFLDMDMSTLYYRFKERDNRFLHIIDNKICVIVERSKLIGD